MALILAKPEVGLTAGVEQAAYPGTGLAMPPGLESIYEYNGIYLNVLYWADKIRLTDIGGFDDAEIRDSREANPASHGETPFNAYYGGRTIVLTGRIEAYTLEKMRDMQMGLRLAFGDLTEKPLIIRTGNIDRDALIYCRKSSGLVMREVQGDFRFFREFQITLRASNPRFVSYRRHLLSGEITTADPYGVELKPFNKGNFYSQPIFIIRGGVTNPTIHNHVTDQSISITGTIPEDDYWTINIAKKTMVNSAGESVFQFLDDGVDWIELAPRDNIVHLHADATAGAPVFDVFWNDTWM